jgi:hypothetical protein
MNGLKRVRGQEGKREFKNVRKMKKTDKAIERCLIFSKLHITTVPRAQKKKTNALQVPPPR